MTASGASPASPPAAEVAAAPSRTKIRRDVTYGTTSDGQPLLLDVYTPASPAPKAGRPVLLAIHGGGWRKLDKGDYGKAVSTFVRDGYVVVAPNYQLSTPARPSWPEALENVRAAVRWIRANTAELRADPDRIAAIGESAGGHLAALLGADTSDPSARVRAVVDFYGPADLIRLDAESVIGRAAVRQFLGGPPSSLVDAARAASPVDRVGPRSAPMMIVQGLADTIVPPDQSIALADALRAKGVRVELDLVPKLGHGFRLRAGRRDFVPEILAFLNANWNDGP